MLLRLILLSLLLALFASPAWAEKLQIFTSILPQKTFVEAIGGEHVEVQAMVKPGLSPATYEPTPRQMAALSNADAYYRIGVAFENAWMPKIIARQPALKIYDARDGVTLRDMSPSHRHADEEHHPHDHGDKDPHIWLDPQRVTIMAQGILRMLIELDPAHAEDYRRNHTAFVARLEQLDRELAQTLAPIEHRAFMVFHPSWGYFAERYGLTQIAIEQEGKTPGARSLSLLIQQAKKQGIRVIFTQKQFSTRYAQAIARAIGANVVSIDPLAADYFDNLLRVASAIVEAQP